MPDPKPRHGPDPWIFFPAKFTAAMAPLFNVRILMQRPLPMEVISSTFSPIVGHDGAGSGGQQHISYIVHCMELVMLRTKAPPSCLNLSKAFSIISFLLIVKTPKISSRHFQNPIFRPYIPALALSKSGEGLGDPTYSQPASAESLFFYCITGEKNCTCDTINFRS